VTRATYILAGGGTGGHLYPGLAVAEEVVKLESDARIVFACSDRGIDGHILGASEYPYAPQPVRPLPARPREGLAFLRAYIRSLSAAREMLQDLRPVAVLGLGGFAAGPVLAMAGRRSPSALLNPDAVVGRANKHLAGKVRAIFTQFPSTREELPTKLQGLVHCVGCPVRSSFIGIDRQDAIERLGLTRERKTVLVLGGSSGAASINDAMAVIANQLGLFADTWQTLHITGRGSEARMREIYSRAKLKATVLGYCTEMDLAYGAADLVLCRGGASTVAELAATGTPAIIMPYPHHRDDQQKLNAEASVAVGAAICIEDTCNAQANSLALKTALLPIMSDLDLLERMTCSAAALPKSTAGLEVAKWLLRQ